MVTKIKTEVHALYAAAAVEGRDDGCRGNALDALRELCNFIAGPETQSPTARLREKEHAAAVRRAPAVSAQVGRPGYFCLPTSPHTRSQSPTSPTSSRSVINELRLEEAAKRGDMDRVARLAVEILRLAQQGDREGVLEVISDRGSPRLPSMAEKAAARAERGDDKGEKVDDRFKRSVHRLTPSGFDLQCGMQPESATPSESLPPPRTPTRDREHLQSALDYGQTPSSEQDRSSSPPPPGKIPPDMLEKAELWARLERLDLLHRLDSVRDSAVSTRSSSLRPPALDHEHLHDMHEPSWGERTRRIVQIPFADTPPEQRERATMLVSELQGYWEQMTQDQEMRFLSAVSKLGKRKPESCQREAASTSDRAVASSSSLSSCGSGQRSQQTRDEPRHRDQGADGEDPLPVDADGGGGAHDSADAGGPAPLECKPVRFYTADAAL